MTETRKTRASLTVRRACPSRLLTRRRASLATGAFLFLTALGSGAHALRGQPDWSEEISPGGSVAIWAFGVSRAEAQRYLERLGLVAGAVADPEVRVYGSESFHGVREAKAEWAETRLELNGKFGLRNATHVFDQAMTTTSVISPDGLLTTDDRGGSRITAYRKFPIAACYVGPEGGDCDERVSFDATEDVRGNIVEFIRDHQGFPSGVRFGETLALRYGFTPPLPEPPGLLWVDPDHWREPSSWELIDLRTSEIVIDSVEAARVASERSVLSVVVRGIGEVIRFEDGQPFAVAKGIRRTPYALLPLDGTAEVWRSVYAHGGGSPPYSFRVDYTERLVRVEIGGRERGRSIVVEAPRGVDSFAPVSFVHPRADMLTDVIRSGVRLRITELLDVWLQGSFEKERLPIVLRPLHYTGIETESGLIREATGAERHSPFGPAEGCEEKDQGILCSGGESDVIGEENPYPW